MLMIGMMGYDRRSFNVATQIRNVPPILPHPSHPSSTTAKPPFNSPSDIKGEGRDHSPSFQSFPSQFKNGQRFFTPLRSVQNDMVLRFGMTVGARPQSFKSFKNPVHPSSTADHHSPSFQSFPSQFKNWQRFFTPLRSVQNDMVLRSE